MSTAFRNGRPMNAPHIVRSFDKDLTRLKDKILEMGVTARSQLTLTKKALGTRDRILAKDIVSGDKGVNALQHEVDRQTVRLLALRQPMALDLRIVISSLKIAGDLERIADYSANIARHIFALENIPSPRPIQSVQEMIDIAHAMLTEALEAFDTLDAPAALAVRRRDDEIDHIYRKVLTQLRTFMTKDKEAITTCTTLLFVARCCERIGDHITNIAESVHYIVSGAPLEDTESVPGRPAAT